MGFLKAMKELNRRSNGFVFIAFYALFGYAISFKLTTADSYRIGAVFCQMDFSYRMVLRMYAEGSITDIYLIFVYSVVKLFTSNPKVLFAVLGSIMGIYSYLSCRQLYKIWEGMKTRYFYIILLFYFLTISFFNVNGIRFWTATSFFSYYAIQYLYLERRTALIGILLTPLIHFGYMVAVIGVFIYLIMKRLHLTTHIYFFLMVVAFIAHVATPQSSLDDLMGSEGDVEEISSSRALNRKADLYRNTSENLNRKQRNDTSLYRQANKAFTVTCEWINKVGMFFLLTVLFLKRRSILMSNKQLQFFQYILFSFALGYIASLLIGSGVRFLRLANLMYFFWLISVFQQNESSEWRKYVRLLFPLNFYALAFLLFNAPRLVTPLLWIAPPFFTIINGLDFQPIDFIK